MLLFWTLVLVLAFPLVLVATAAIGSVVYASTVEPQENNDPIVFSTNTVWIGPFSVATNARGWAGVCVIVDVIVTVVGLIGLFHFPTPFTNGTENHHMHPAILDSGSSESIPPT